MAVDFSKEFRVNLNTLSMVAPDIYARVNLIPNTIKEVDTVIGNTPVEVYTIGMAHDVVGFKFGRLHYVRLRELPMIFADR